MPELKRKFKLGELLLTAGKINQEQLDDALKRAKAANRILGETLIEMGAVKQTELLQIVGQQIGLPAVELRAGMIDSTAVDRIPREKAQFYGVIPMFYVQDKLTVAISRPLSIFDFDDLERIADCSIQLVLCPPEQVRSAIEKNYASEVNVDSLIGAIDAKVEIHDGEENKKAEEINEYSENSPVASLVNYVLSTAITEKASDIHIEPDGKILRVRYRIDGVLREMMTQKISLHPAMVSRIKVMARLDIAERRRPQDGRIQVVISGREIDIRVSTLPTTGGEKVVMRVLDSSNLVLEFEQLGFRTDLITKFRRILTRPHGLILVTGPTGSGKTTTLYSALQQLRSPEKIIITIEDPVEYQLGMINQVQVNANIDLTFASVMRSVLRQDPNIIMLGEIRDSETAKTAVEASLTGHLVLSTLHTNDSVGAITRLVNIGVEPFLVASSVIGVVAQRLARKICQQCRARTEVHPDLRARLMLPDDGTPYFKGAGCKTCFNSGYRGRVGLYEIFEIQPESRGLLESNASAGKLRAVRKKAGETTLFEEGIIAAKAGMTSLEEVLRVTGAPSDEKED
ncbi:MAG TPA: ATPase, T2SS/T4P/T4SS family [Phycisphaerae bacterium]|nr:ATPase, T2SS/T4P/T4SS family [Phycisphaerae bacterium]